MSSHLPPSLAVESLSQKKLGIDIVRAVRKDKYEPLQVTPFPVLRVSRLFYFFAHLDLLSTDSSLLWSYFFFLSLLWLFPPLLLHLSISSEIWLLNFLRWIQTGCILETKQTHTHIYIYMYIYIYCMILFKSSQLMCPLLEVNFLSERQELQGQVLELRSENRRSVEARDVILRRWFTYKVVPPR